MVLGKLPVPGRPTIWITVGQGPIALTVGAGGDCLDIFTLLYLFSPLSPSLWETVRYRLKYCLKGPLNPKQPTNQPILLTHTYTLSAISGGGLVDRKLVEAPPSPSNFIVGRPKAALLFWFFMTVLSAICLWSASIATTCIAAHFALCRAL